MIIKVHLKMYLKQVWQPTNLYNRRPPVLWGLVPLHRRAIHLFLRPDALHETSKGTQFVFVKLPTY